jgi:hypothetical protein
MTALEVVFYCATYLANSAVAYEDGISIVLYSI